VGILRPFIIRRSITHGALLAGALVGAVTAPAGAQQLGSGAGTGAPMPLLAPSTGTLDPSQGELMQPPPPLTTGPITTTPPSLSADGGMPANPTLAPPRVIGGGPGSRTELPPPSAPLPPSGGSLPFAASPSAGTAAVTRGSTNSADAEALGNAMGAVSNAAATVSELRADSGFKKDMNEFLDRARAVVVIPSFFRAGFFVGAAYGSAVLSVRDDSGAFSEPAFFRVTAGSLGFQFGAQDARVILLVMTDAGLRAILKDQFKLEASANITFGLFGGGISTGSTTDVNQDIIAFSHSRGIFGGGAFEGAMMEPRPDWNAVYYGTPGITAEAILFERRVANPTSRPLIEALQAPSSTGG